MCGIAGLIDFRCESNIENLKDMTDTLYHRGPDDGGYFFKDFDKSQIGLGHRRLSILDLSNHGHQPMTFEHLTMVYNGEVYNFKEIRLELEEQGYFFDSQSDTEVILKAYHCWGARAVHRFNGMFSIAIFDDVEGKLFLIRDRAGVKPLYWYYKNGLFLFSSELKSFHKHRYFDKNINHDSVALFLQYGYVPQPYTIFDDTHKLKAGHSLEIDINTAQTKTEKYWDVIDCYNQPKLDISLKESIDETERLLKSACEYRMVADVPVGVFLSGGYDSSAVTALLQSERTEKLKTFSIGFHDPRYNEANFAKNVADHLGTDHTEYYCTQQDALDILPKLPEIWDEPFGDSSAIPTTLVSQLARKDVTVSLSADGGDEVFGGYDKYNSIHKKRQVLSRIPSAVLPLVKNGLSSKATHFSASKFGMYNAEKRLSRLATMLGQDEQGLLKIGSQVFTDLELDLLLIKKSNRMETEFDTEINNNWLDNILALDYKTYQSDGILTKVDRATMSASLEGREPLLDHNIIEFVSRLDPNFKIRNGTRKYILKEITHKYLPKEMMDRPKKGFGIPIFDWFKKDLSQYILYYLSEERLKDSGIFNVSYIVNLRNQYLSGSDVNINQIWYLLMFEMWREKWG
ncbi:asparagine synthase (glutamine-hydrolyzing) [Vibrio crassostreae]|uniref:asparagine synthase (glutamine-hydrolyzing) n=1 Tax=Vibrio crassostreae TaxID=246167 RepID=UPI001B3017B5|nr:asparagine synthase (glutamine-hydrolyzing) [Vibrio crassostreae]